MKQAGLFSAVLALPLAACGGGSQTPPPPPNLSPVFTSSSSASVVENSTGTAYLASATDAENNPLTFTIGGPDAARFTISSGGAVQFASPPNFDSPADADKDNAYLIEVAASDGVNTVRQAVEIKVTNSTEGISVRRVATGLTDIVSMAPVPGDTSKMFIAQSEGIYLFDLATGTRTLFWAPPPPPTVAASIGREFIVSFAPAPDYQSSHAFYAGIRQTDHSGIRYYEPRPDGSYIQPAVAYFGNYGPIPGFAVGPDKNVYVFKPAFDLLTTSSPDLTNAAILRLARNGLGFSPAPGNPYLTSGGLPEVFDYGVSEASGVSFYNGYVIFFSSPNEVNMASMTNGGFSFGWPFFEGTVRKKDGGPASVVDPVMLLPESSDATGSALGGLVYTGPIASLSGKYLYLTTRGLARTIDLSLLVPGKLAPTQVEARDQDFVPDVGTLNGVKFMRQDDAGTVWFLTATGELYQMRAS